MPSATIEVGLSVGTLAVVSVWILPFLYHNLSFSKRRQSNDGYPLYKDEDGVATKESQDRYSVWIQKYLILLGCAIGIVSAVSDAIQITVRENAVEAIFAWIYFVVWVRVE